MPDVRVNTSSYKFYFDPLQASPTFAAACPGITGYSIEDNSSSRSIRALGDGKWQKMIQETLGVTFNLTLDHLLDDSDDSIETNQQILATACSGTDVATNVISVKFVHPSGTLETTGLFSVLGGKLGLGNGGSDGSFNTASYRLVSYGAVTTA